MFNLTPTCYFSIVEIAAMYFLRVHASISRFRSARLLEGQLQAPLLSVEGHPEVPLQVSLKGPASYSSPLPKNTAQGDLKDHIASVWGGLTWGFTPGNEC